MIAVSSPKIMTLMPAILGVLFMGAFYYWQQLKIQFSKTAILFGCIVIGLSWFSVLFSSHFSTSLEKSIILSLFIPPHILLICLTLSLPREDILKYGHYLGFAVIIALVVTIFEILTDGILFNLVRGRPFSTYVAIFEYNRPLTMLTLLSISAYILVGSKINTKLRAYFIGIPLLTALALSVCQAAQLMVLVGLFFLFVFPYKSKWAWLTLRIIILSLMMVAPFASIYIYNHYSHAIQDLPMMANAYAGHRLEIWDYVGRYTLQHPLFGQGIEVTRAITDFDSKRIFVNDNTTNHPHNFAIQIWLEFGLFGMIIAMSIMAYLLTLIQKQYSVVQQKILLPTMMMTLVASSVSYGMWQGIWMGTIFFVAMMCLMACKSIETPK